MRGLASEADADRLIAMAGLDVIERPAREPRLRGLLCGDVVVLRSGQDARWRTAAKAHEAGHRLLGHAGNLLYVVTPNWQPIADRLEAEAHLFAGAFVLGTPHRPRFADVLNEAHEAGFPLEFLFGYVGALNYPAKKVSY